jgi:hypothetical protein
VPAGDYWIGLITGGTSNVAETRYEADGTLAFNANDFAAGPSNPFGPFTTNNQRLSVKELYSVDHP